NGLNVAHSHDVLDPSQLNQFILAHYGATINGRPYIRIETQQLLRCFQSIKEIRNAFGRSQRFELFRDTAEAVQKKLFARLNVRAIEEPGVPWDDPAYPVRINLALEQP